MYFDCFFSANCGFKIEIGNTKSQYEFSIEVKKIINGWSEHGPAYLCAIGMEYIASTID
jgi:L-arabinose isomerase